jgi:hypothetical protein
MSYSSRLEYIPQPHKKERRNIYPILFRENLEDLMEKWGVLDLKIQRGKFT